MKSVLVIGAGKFGHHIAEFLCDMGNDVTLVDKSETLIEEYADTVTNAEIGDFTIKNNLSALNIKDYDYAFVCIGDFQDSLVTTSYLKELGARYVISKASSLTHEKFLLQNGADEVVFPERDTAYRLAVEYDNSKVFDYFQLSQDTGIFEIAPPDKWIGKSLSNLNVRKIHNLTVIAYKNGDVITPINTPDYVFTKDEHIIVMGTKHDIKKIVK